MAFWCSLLIMLNCYRSVAVIDAHSTSQFFEMLLSPFQNTIFVSEIILETAPDTITVDLKLQTFTAEPIKVLYDELFFRIFQFQYYVDSDLSTLDYILSFKDAAPCYSFSDPEYVTLTKQPSIVGFTYDAGARTVLSSGKSFVPFVCGTVDGECEGVYRRYRLIGSFKGYVKKASAK